MKGGPVGRAGGVGKDSLAFFRGGASSMPLELEMGDTDHDLYRTDQRRLRVKPKIVQKLLF